MSLFDRLTAVFRLGKGQTPADQNNKIKEVLDDNFRPSRCSVHPTSERSFKRNPRRVPSSGSRPRNNHHHQLRNPLGSRNHRWLKTGVVGVITAIALSLVITPAYAAETNLDDYENLTGTDSSYWENRFIYTNSATQKSLSGFASNISYATSSGGSQSVSMGKPFAVQLACPEQVVSISDCDFIVTISSNYLTKMFNLGNKANTYSPAYNINDKILYYIIVRTTDSRDRTVPWKIPILVQDNAPVVTTRIPWQAMRFANPWIANGGSNTYGYNYGASKLFDPAFAYISTRNFDACLADNQSQKAYLSRNPLLFNNGPYGAGSSFYSVDNAATTEFYSDNAYKTKNARDYYKQYPIKSMDVSIAGYAHNTWAPKNRTWFDAITNPGQFFGELFGSSEVDNSCQVFATTGAPKDSISYSDSPAHASAGVIGSGVKGNIEGYGNTHPTVTNALTPWCMNIASQPIADFGDVDCKLPGGDRGQDFRIFTMFYNLTGVDFAALQGKCADDFACDPNDPDPYESNKAKNWLKKKGNTTDSEGYNCSGSTCTKRNVITDFRVDNRVDTKDPYTKPEDRPEINECFGKEFFGIIPTSINWDCVMTGLFVPSLDTINETLGKTYTNVSTVLFPLGYAVEGYQLLTNVTSYFSPDSCKPTKVNIRKAGQMTILPCPNGSGDAASYMSNMTRVIIPWGMFLIFALMMVRRITSRFGFGSSNYVGSGGIDMPVSTEAQFDADVDKAKYRNQVQRAARRKGDS